MRYTFSDVILDDGTTFDRLKIEVARLYMTPLLVYDKTLTLVSQKGIEVEDFSFSVSECEYEILIRRDPNAIDKTRVKGILGDAVMYRSLDDNDA